jgi:hypothetical protein
MSVPQSGPVTILEGSYEPTWLNPFTFQVTASEDGTDQIWTYAVEQMVRPFASISDGKVGDEIGC